MTHNTRADAATKDEAAAAAFVLGSPLGRAYVWALLSKCNIYGASFTPDPITMAYNEGRRAIGIGMLHTIDANAFGMMQAEATERQMRYHVTDTPEGEYE